GRLRRGHVRGGGGRHEPGPASAGSVRRPPGGRYHFRAEAAGVFRPRDPGDPGPPGRRRAGVRGGAGGAGQLGRGAAARPGIHGPVIGREPLMKPLLLRWFFRIAFGAVGIAFLALAWRFSARQPVLREANSPWVPLALSADEEVLAAIDSSRDQGP